MFYLIASQNPLESLCALVDFAKLLSYLNQEKIQVFHESC